MSHFGDSVARTWTRAYTRGLPGPLCDRRREEIAADLHDHAAWAGRTPGQQINVIGRVLWGIPADLSWRRAARASRPRRLETGAPMTLRKTTTVVVTFIATLNLVIGLGVFFGTGGDGEDVAGGWRWALPALIGAGLLAYALRFREDAPRRTTVAIVIGSAVPMGLLYWMAPIFFPFWLAASVLAVLSEPGRRSAAPAV